MDLKHILEKTVDCVRDTANGVFSVDLQLAENASNIVVCTGSNASGKSFFAELFALECKQTGIKTITVSMSRRTAEGMHRAFMYGCEHSSSTGVNSCASITGSFKCTASWGDRVIILDEAEIGLSEEYQWAVGTVILQAVKADPTILAVLVCTHSRILVQSLISGLEKHHHVRMGDKKIASLQEYVNRPFEKTTPSDLENLADVCHKQRVAISKWLRK